MPLRRLLLRVFFWEFVCLLLILVKHVRQPQRVCWDTILL